MIALVMILILVVLVIVGVLSVLVVPQMEIVKYKMDGTTRGVVMALVTAQRTAVKKQHPVVVVFDTANRRLVIHEDADSDNVMDDGERVRLSMPGRHAASMPARMTRLIVGASRPSITTSSTALTPSGSALVVSGRSVGQ